MNLRSRKQKAELDANISKGRKLLTEGRHRENFENLQQAVQRFPNDPEIRWLYAATLLEFRPEDVAAEAEKAAELGADSPSILVRAGSLLLNRGDRAAARSCAERAARLAPPDFPLVGGLENLEGLLAALAGEDDIAEGKLRGAVEKEPTNEPFVRNFAVFLAERGRLREGAKVLDEALALADNKEAMEAMRDRMAAEADS